MDVAEAYVRLRPKKDPNFERDAQQQLASPLAKIAEGAALAFGAVKVGSFFRDSIAEQREAVRVGALTQQVLRTTGAQANVTAEDVDRLARSLSKMAGVDDEVIHGAENVLLTFTQVRNEAGKGNDIFNQATKAALDLSTAFGTDLNSAIIQVGKALNSPLQGMVALRRVGVQFTQAQQDQIKALVESNRLLDAQKLILDGLAQKFGGAAAAAANPAEKFHAAVKNLEESVGAALVPALNVAEKGLTNITNAFTSLPQGAQTTIVTIGTLAAGALAAEIAFTRLAAALEGTALAGAASSVGAIGLAAIPVVAPLVAVGAAVYEIGYASDNVSGKINKTLDNVTSAIAAGNGSITTTAQAAVAAFLQISEASQAFAESGKHVSDFIAVALQGDGAIKRFVASMNLGPTATKTLTKELLQLGHAIQGGTTQGAQLNAILGDVASSEDTAAAAAKNFADATTAALDATLGRFIEVQSATLGVVSSESALTDAIAATGDEAASSAGKMKTYADAVAAVFDPVLAADRAGIAARKALSSLTDAVGSQAKAAYAAGHNLIRLDGQQASSADDVKGALLDVIQAREQEVDAEAKSGEIADTAASRHQALVDKLLDLRNQYPQLAGDIDKYIDAAKKIPELPLDVVADKTAKAQKGLADNTLAVITALERQAKADDDPIHGLDVMNGELETLIGKYKGFPAIAKQFSDALAASIATEDQIKRMRDFWGFLAAINNPQTAVVAGALAGLGLSVPALPGLLSMPPGRAGGGPVTGGLPYWVGEHGPEPFIPATSGTIVSHEDAMASIGGRGPTIQTGNIIVGDRGTARDVIYELRALSKGIF